MKKRDIGFNVHAFPDIIDGDTNVVLVGLSNYHNARTFDNLHRVCMVKLKFSPCFFQVHYLIGPMAVRSLSAPSA